MTELRQHIKNLMSPEELGGCAETPWLTKRTQLVVPAQVKITHLMNR